MSSRAFPVAGKVTGNSPSGSLVAEGALLKLPRGSSRLTGLSLLLILATEGAAWLPLTRAGPAARQPAAPREPECQSLSVLNDIGPGRSLSESLRLTDSDTEGHQTPRPGEKRRAKGAQLELGNELKSYWKDVSLFGLVANCVLLQS